MKKREKHNLVIEEGNGFLIYGEFASYSKAETIAKLLPPIIKWSIRPVVPSFADLVEAYAGYGEVSVDAAIWEVAHLAHHDDDILDAITDYGVEADFDREDLERLLATTK